MGWIFAEEPMRPRTQKTALLSVVALAILLTTVLHRLR
jgi:hypothetical protein